MQIQEAAARGGAYCRSGASGLVDFYVDGELQLTEPFAEACVGLLRASYLRTTATEHVRQELESRWSQEGYKHRRLNPETGELEIDSDAEEDDVRAAAAGGGNVGWMGL